MLRYKSRLITKSRSLEGTDKKAIVDRQVCPVMHHTPCKSHSVIFHHHKGNNLFNYIADD